MLTRWDAALSAQAVAAGLGRTETVEGELEHGHVSLSTETAASLHQTEPRAGTDLTGRGELLDVEQFGADDLTAIADQPVETPLLRAQAAAAAPERLHRVPPALGCPAS